VSWRLILMITNLLFAMIQSSFFASISNFVNCGSPK
jgi:hypothetical protein